MVYISMVVRDDFKSKPDGDTVAAHGLYGHVVAVSPLITRPRICVPAAAGAPTINLSLH